MNLDDKKKIIDVFVDVEKYGQPSKIDKFESDEVLKHIKNSDELLDQWEKFMFRKAISPELEESDKWDEWYNNLTFDTIDQKDVKIFDLPQSKFKVSLNNEQSFIHELYALAKNFINDCKPYCNPSTNMHVSYDFCHEGIFINFYAKSGVTIDKDKKYDSKARTAVNGIYIDLTNQLKSIINRFNNSQTNGIMAQYQAYNGDNVRLDVHTARGVVISNEDLFYSNKSLVSQDYYDMIFGIINDSVDYY